MSRKTAEERRSEALDAARRIIDTHGIAHASVRNVAAEAGMSAGSLRHIFPSHEDLFVALLDDSMSAAIPRIQRVMGAASASTLDMAIDMLLEVLPTRPDTRLEALSQLAVLVAHGANPRVIEARRRAGDGMDEMCRHILHWSTSPPPGAALELRLLVDGLMLRLLERTDIGEAEVREHLRGILIRLGLPADPPGHT
ncbi:TetR/AcrR family transcriptional regulator [Corynebacterium sp.]|uniref:TetR/AcrR family transcriptional regulator n=1 Tax=Corynebacterium sp. TaxID=1720 RepID=UPI0026DF7A22|nr:TetR/AcrR family transcriptional regulator [Corynebacterium sp.]MDO5512220.1 TetR/AcrR family transcriptional regulator [Corynebacterium sp.]